MDSMHTTAPDEPSRSPRLSVESFGATDPGRRRPTNEDQFLIATLTKTMEIAQTSLRESTALQAEEQGHLFVVADGMGGHNAGEQASALAIAVIERFALNSFKWFTHEEAGEEVASSSFGDAVRQADATIIEETTNRPDLRGMGTTLTLAYVLGSDLFVVHVGDSRAYLVRHGAMHQLTRDHTVVAEMVRRGEIRPDQASRHQLRHVITNVLGGRDVGVHAEAHVLTLCPDDGLLLCSDGLTEMVAHEEVASILADAPNPEAACTRLIARANELGGDDNVTVLVARFRACNVCN